MIKCTKCYRRRGGESCFPQRSHRGLASVSPFPSQPLQSTFPSLLCRQARSCDSSGQWDVVRRDVATPQAGSTRPSQAQSSSLNGENPEGLEQGSARRREGSWSLSLPLPGETGTLMLDVCWEKNKTHRTPKTFIGPRPALWELCYSGHPVLTHGGSVNGNEGLNGC